MAEIHHHGLIRSNAGILESAKYSDMTVLCGSQEFKLHRNIVCPRSKFFAAACDGQFKEAQTSTIVLEEDDPPTVRRMLTYLYTLTYDDEGDAASAEHYMVNGAKPLNAATTPSTPLSEEELSRDAKMLNNVVVYAIAHKYDISELKELAKSKFHELLWLKAPSHGLPGVIDVVFKTTSITDSGLLRNVVAEYCTHFTTKIVADDQLSSMIKDHGELGLDVLRQHSKKQEDRVTLKWKLAQMIKDASNINVASWSEKSWSELRRNIQMVHDIIKKE